jgi:hypothetical protein
MSHSPEGFAELIDEKVRRQFGAAVTFCVLPLFVTYEKSSNSRSSSRDVQLLGDLSLGATLGEQFGGAFPTGLAVGPLLGDPRSCLLLAAVGRHGVRSRTRRFSIQACSGRPKASLSAGNGESTVGPCYCHHGGCS